MTKYKILCMVFALAACFYIAGTINHILNTGEGILSSILLAAGCICLSFSFYKGYKNAVMIERNKNNSLQRVLHVDKSKKVSVAAVILNCICAVVWNINMFIDIAYGFTNSATFVLHVVCAIVWDFCAVLWIGRYIKSKKSSEWIRFCSRAVMKVYVVSTESKYCKKNGNFLVC